MPYLKWQPRPQVLVVLAALALIWPLAFPYSEAIRSANERPRIAQAVALADRGQWELGPLQSAGMQLGPDLATVQGRIYPNKPPAVSVVGAVLLRAGDVLGHRWTYRSFTYALRVAVGLLPMLLMLWAVGRYYVASLGSHLWFGTAMLFVLGTPMISYARLAYGHVLAGGLAMTGLLCVLGARTRAMAPSQNPDKAWVPLALGGGALCSLGVSADYLAAFWGPCVALALVVDAFTRGSWRLLAWSAGGAAVGLAPLLVYQANVFGSAFETGYHHSATAAFAAKHAQGFLGLGWPRAGALVSRIFAPQAGLLWWMPISLLGAYGLWLEQRSVRRSRLECRLLLSIFLVGLSVVLCLNFEGGWRVGPRYLVVFLPAVLPGLGFLLARQRDQPVSIVLVGTLLLFSMLLNVTAGSLWPHLDVQNMTSPVAELLRPLLVDGYAPYGWARDVAKEMPFLLYLGLPVFLAWVTYGKLQVQGYRNALAWVTATFLGLCAANWLPHVFHAHPRAAANLAYVRRVFEPPKPPSGQEQVPVPEPVSAPLPRLRRTKVR